MPNFDTTVRFKTAKTQLLSYLSRYVDCQIAIPIKEGT